MSTSCSKFTFQMLYRKFTQCWKYLLSYSRHIYIKLLDNWINYFTFSVEGTGSTLAHLSTAGRAPSNSTILNGALKVIRKFFLTQNKSFRWHLGDYEKHHFFPISGSVRGGILIFVCSYGCVVGPAGGWGLAWRRPLPQFSLYKPVFKGPTTHP